MKNLIPKSKVGRAIPGGSSVASPHLPEVRCAFTLMVDLSELKPNPRNPNQHPAEQLRIFAKILNHQGIRRPAVRSIESGLLVTGHGLSETLALCGAKQCPIDDQHFPGSAPGVAGPDEIAHLLADNSLPQLADLDLGELATLNNEISLAGLDLELTGAMFESPTPVVISDVATQSPPKYTWVLIGLPTPRFGEISERIEALAAIKDIFLETTSNDGPKDKTNERKD